MGEINGRDPKGVADTVNENLNKFDPVDTLI